MGIRDGGEGEKGLWRGGRGRGGEGHHGALADPPSVPRVAHCPCARRFLPHPHVCAHPSSLHTHLPPLSPPPPLTPTPQISAGGKTTSLGDHETEVAAARAFDRACINKAGADARTNFPLVEYADEMDQLIREWSWLGGWEGG